jgi:tetratricopeptide (TPR) repeat protein
MSRRKKRTVGGIYESMSIMNSNQQNHIRIIVLCLFLLTVAVYWPVHGFDFVQFDDNKYVTENQRVRSGLSAEGLVWAFRNLDAGFWFPLTWISHMLDCEMFGLNPGGHHFINVLFHTVNVVLLFFLLNRLTGAVWKSSFVAALFAVHPLNVEPVAWIATRKDLLSTFFWMLSCLVYVRYTEEQKPRQLILVCFLFTLGLMSKTVIVTLPLVLLLLDYWPLDRMGNRNPSTSSGDSQPTKTHGASRQPGWVTLVSEKIPLFFLATLFVFLTFVAETHVDAVQSLASFPLSARVANAIRSYSVYMVKWVYPHDLAVFYPHPGAGIPAWKMILPTLLMFLMTLVVFVKKKHRYLTVGWLWYIVTLIPVIGLVQIGTHGMADRYVYIPMIGLSIMAAWGMFRLLEGLRYGRIFLAVSAIVVVALLCLGTRYQMKNWQNGITLFRHTLQVTSDNYKIHHNLGVLLMRRGKTKEAVHHYQEAIRIKPDFEDPHYNLGFLHAKQGQLDKAAEHYVQVLRINPRHVNAHNNLGVVLARQGKRRKAIIHFSKALEIEPGLVSAQKNLAAVSRERKSSSSKEKPLTNHAHGAEHPN